MVNAYSGISKAFDSIGDLSNAHKNLIQYSELQNTIFEKRNQDLVLSIQKDHELTEKANTIKSLEKNNKLLRIIQIGSVVILLLLIWIGLSTIHRQKERAKKQRIIKEKEIQLIQAQADLTETHLKNAEMEMLILKQENELQVKRVSDLAQNIVHKNELAETMKTRMKNLKTKEEFKNSIDVLNQLEIQLYDILDQDADQQELKFLVENDKQKFLNQLRITYPDLTPSECQLLEFLKLKLDSKAIANILGISTESVHTKRYRLRKKLGLASEDSLIDFVEKVDIFHCDK